MGAFRSSHHPFTKLASVPFLPSPSDHPPTQFASVPSLPSTSYKCCGRSVPLITLPKRLRALRSSHPPPNKLPAVFVAVDMFAVFCMCFSFPSTTRRIVPQAIVGGARIRIIAHAPRVAEQDPCMFAWDYEASRPPESWAGVRSHYQRPIANAIRLPDSGL